MGRQIVLAALALTFVAACVVPAITHDTWFERGHKVTRCRLTGETRVELPKHFVHDCFGGFPSDSVFGP